MLNQPKSTKIDLKILTDNDLEYYCSSLEIDKQVYKALGLPYNEELAADMAKSTPFYFVVKTNREYGLLQADLFEQFLKEKTIYLANDVKPGITAKAVTCKAHFIDYLTLYHKKHAARLLKTNKLNG